MDKNSNVKYVTMDQFNALEQRVEKLENLLNNPSTTSVTKKTETLREFIKAKHPSNDVEKTICIIYYREMMEGVEEVSSTDVKEGFRHAREKVPMNVSDKLGLCAKRGFIDSVREERGKIYWSITNTGIDFVVGL